MSEIVVQGALQFEPNGKDVKDLDLDHLARQTAILNDLLRIYGRIDRTRESEFERAAFRDTIEALQQSLYPWITAAKGDRRSYISFFDLIDSYEEEAGIVITVGKNGGFRWAVHQIVTLRAVLRSTLPIEVFYAGDEDLPTEYREFIDEIQSTYDGYGTITIIDINHRFLDPDGTLGLPGGWAMRPFAMLASSFKHVILSDADTIFLRDPRVLLQESTYQHYGSVFWHDRILDPAKDEIYNWADELLARAKVKDLDKVKEENAGWFSRRTWYELERYGNFLSMLTKSGALIVDKTRNLGALLMTCYMNSKRVREEITYVRFWGDKESYWFSHTLTSTPYHYVPGYAGGIGTITPQTANADKEHVCTSRILHLLESTGEPFWFNSGLSEFKWHNDDKYSVPDGWVGHNAEWYKDPGATRLDQFCAQVPEGFLRLQDPVKRVEGALKRALEEMIQLAKTYDDLMVHAGLIKIA